jgi:hypothetical protein
MGSQICKDLDEQVVRQIRERRETRGWVTLLLLGERILSKGAKDSEKHGNQRQDGRMEEDAGHAKGENNEDEKRGGGRETRGSRSGQRITTGLNLTQLMNPTSSCMRCARQEEEDGGMSVG